jgi:hypothetical protein
MKKNVSQDPLKGMNWQWYWKKRLSWIAMKTYRLNTWLSYVEFVHHILANKWPILLVNFHFSKLPSWIPGNLLLPKRHRDQQVATIELQLDDVVLACLTQILNSQVTR